MKLRPGASPDDLPAGMTPFAREVLDLVDTIPLGRVMSYGEISAYLGGPGPRMVARVMSTWGGEAKWWRVLRADGSCAPEVRARQMRLLRAEGVVFRSKDRVDMDASGYAPPD